MGQIGPAVQNPKTFAPQPSGFSGAEWGTRMAGMGLKGLGQGLQNYEGQNAQMRQGGATGMMQPAQGAAPVDPSYFQPQNGQQRTRNPFYGGYGPSGS